MTSTVTELRTGRRPQNAILCRGIARPDLFYTKSPITTTRFPSMFQSLPLRPP